MLVSGVVTIAAGIAVAGGFTFEGPALPEPPPMQARVECQPEGTVVRTDSVLASRDGVHIVVENASRARLLEIRSATDEPLGEIPILTDAVTQTTFQIPPGPITVTCTAGRDTDHDRSAGVLTVLDPHDRWITLELVCPDEDLETVEFVVEEIPLEPAPATARRAVPGLRGSDELEKPGYPGSLWQGDLVVVVREGETVGRITRAQDRGSWHVLVSACPGTGLAEG